MVGHGQCCHHLQLLAVEDGTWQVTHTDTDIPFNITVWIDFGSNQGKDKVNDGLVEMFFNQTQCNFLFMFNDGQSVGAHAEILSAGSPVLSALFQSSCLELKSRKMSIIDCEIQVFKQPRVFIHKQRSSIVGEDYSGSFCVSRQISSFQVKGSLS